MVGLTYASLETKLRYKDKSSLLMNMCREWYWSYPENIYQIKKVDSDFFEHDL